MPDTGRAAGWAQHRYHVEPQLRPEARIAVRLLVGQPAQREAPQPARLRPQHRLGRVAVGRRRAGLHFTEDQDRAVRGDDVEFAVGAAPVAGDEGQTGLDEVTLGDLLPVLPDGILGAHGSTLPAATPELSGSPETVDNHRACG